MEENEDVGKKIFILFWIYFIGGIFGLFLFAITNDSIIIATYFGIYLLVVSISFVVNYSDFVSEKFEEDEENGKKFYSYFYMMGNPLHY